MKVTASILNDARQNQVTVTTNGNEKHLNIAVKKDGRGSSVNGGELLFLALATCFCNDIYREATKRHLDIRSVEVFVSGEFGAEGEPARNIAFEVNLDTDLPQHEIEDLLNTVDKLAEVHNTLRAGTSVLLKHRRNTSGLV